MKDIKAIFQSSLFLVAFLMVPSVVAEEWQGIVPLQSARQDVVRLLGQCSDQADQCEFSLPTEDVRIVFSGPHACPGRVPSETVLLIERELHTSKTLAALGVDKRRFKSFDPSWPRKIGYRGYIDERAGLILKTFNGAVFQIDYIAVKERRSLCPSYYRKPREFIDAIAEHAPIVSIRCPKNNPTAGEIVALTADYHRSGLRVFLEWRASAGKILEGQGRRRIMLDTSGLEGQTITVLVERADTLYHTSTAACKLQISPIKNL